MTPITKADLARRAGKSAQYIDKVQKKYPPVIDFIEVPHPKSGKIKILVNPEGELTRKFLIKCLGSGTSPQKKPHAQKKTTGPIIEHAEESETKTWTPPTEAVQQEKHDLEKIKLKKQIEEIEIKNEIKRGELIEKKLLKRFFARMYSIDENQLKSIGIKVTPEISEIYNEENDAKTKEILKLIKKEKDKSLGQEIKKILNAGEPDRMLKTTKALENTTGTILKAIKREIDKFLLRLKKEL